MLSRSSLFPGAFLVAAMLVTGCEERTPSAPSAVSSRNPSGTPQQSQVVGTWNVTVRVTESRGTGCVADSLRADINTHNQYSLSLVQKGDATEAILASASGDFVCTYPADSDSTGFTEAPGYYNCGLDRRMVRCEDGTVHALVPMLGQSISGRFSGSEVSGVWSAGWMDVTDDQHDVETLAQFTGDRQ